VSPANTQATAAGAPASQSVRGSRESSGSQESPAIGICLSGAGARLGHAAAKPGAVGGE
jgi:hypothetical protein